VKEREQGRGVDKLNIRGVQGKGVSQAGTLGR